MVKIINGKKYNTDTAEEVVSWWNGLGWNDFHAVQETLYRKHTGEFFHPRRGRRGYPVRGAVRGHVGSWKKNQPVGNSDRLEKKEIELFLG